MNNNLITPPKYLPDMIITMGLGDSEKSKYNIILNNFS